MNTVYYAQVATDGTITQSGLSETSIPTGATAITTEQYATIQASPRCHLVNGVLILSPALVETPPDLAAFKVAASAQIDAAAEAARQRFISPGAGQALEYEATAADASRALAMATETDLKDADYPWLAAERDALTASGQTFTLLEVAAMAQATTAQWAAAGSAIKRIRRTAKIKVDAAATLDGVHSALDGISWPTA